MDVYVHKIIQSEVGKIKLTHIFFLFLNSTLILSNYGLCNVQDRMLRESSGFGHSRITSPEKFSLFLAKVPLQFSHADISLNLGCSSFTEDPQALCGPGKECCVA